MSGQDKYRVDTPAGPAQWPDASGPVRDPHTAREWQEAADAAELMLAIDSAARYGLVTWTDAAGVPQADNVNVERCVEILERAKARGVTPRPLSVLLAELPVRR